MKKVFLHDGLGKRFGFEWDLNVESAQEAVSALFANNPEIEKYLIQQELKGISYGIKKRKNGEFLTEEGSKMRGGRVYHVFAVPQGRDPGTVVTSLIMMAVSTAASMYLSKKLAEAMEHDEETLVAQTQSYIYQGATNRYQQGSTIPVGYGRLKVGSNVISSCSLNYEYDSDAGKIIGWRGVGLDSVMPSYYAPYYDPELGPLGSSAKYSAFGGQSVFSMQDPKFKSLMGTVKDILRGANGGAYGRGYMSSEDYAAGRMKLKEGNAWGGYFKYTYNYGKGVDKSLLGNWIDGGDWQPNALDDKAPYPFSVPGESNAEKTSFTAVQSVPQIETSESKKIFYPISFTDGKQLTPATPLKSDADDGFDPILVGQRYKGGNKDNGLGWHKLESASVFKALDLVAEGPVEGLSTRGGDSLVFKKSISDAEVEKECLLREDNICVRNPLDDYLQGVELDDSPVKEVIEKAGTSKDSYNVNEFDIDIGMSAGGIIGSDNQVQMDPQYQFTANTKDIGGTLFGHRALNVNDVRAGSQNSDFAPNTMYKKGSTVLHEGTRYRVSRSLNNKFKSTENYTFIEGAMPLIVKHPDKAKFYEATGKYMEIEKVDYTKANGKTYQKGSGVFEPMGGDVRYYEFGDNYSKFVGKFESSNSYNQIGSIIFDKGMPWKITGSWPPPSKAKYKVISSFCEPITIDDDEFPIVGRQSPALYVIARHPQFGAPYVSDITAEIKLEDTAYWNEINIKEPNLITDQKQKPIPQLQIGGSRPIFQEIGEEIAGGAGSDLEEYYLSHTIINPLVREVYISLQVDELGYVYEGDTVEIDYSPGPMLAFTLGLIIAAAMGADAATEVDEPFQWATFLLYVAWGIVAGIVLAITAANIEFSMGEKVENSGEIWPNKAKFRIKYGNEGEIPYDTDIYIYGVATSPYRKDIKIYLPPNPQEKDRTIKVYKLNRERNPVREGEAAARYKEKMSLAAVTEVTPVQLSYPNSVVIGSRVNARDYPSIPTRNYNLKMSRVAVPSNYDAEARTYEGSWNGLFKGQSSRDDSIAEEAKTWTDNPAWCMYDLISNKRYGVGRFGIRPENIDRWTLYKIAKYCDQMVPTGYSPKYHKRNFEWMGATKINIKADATYTNAQFNKEFAHPRKKLAIYYPDGTHEVRTIVNSEGGDSVPMVINLDKAPSQNKGSCATEIDYPLVEPRYTLNAYIMNEQNAFKMINEFSSIFRAFAYWAGNAIHFFQDEYKESLMLFSNNNVSEEGFAYSSTPRTSRTNACKIKYLDRYNNFRPKMEYSEDRESINKNNLIEQSIDGFGITSKAQAKRASEFLVQGANLETELINFRTSSIGSYIRPGDIIDVLDNKRTIGRFAGKVVDISISGDGKMAELDIDFPVRTIVDEDDPSTYKKITLYKTSGNQTIESLDKATKGGSVAIPDQLIDDMRVAQIGEYLVSKVSNNDTRIKLSNNPYSFITGLYTWSEALRDAKKRGGQLATIANDTDQAQVQAVLPNNTGGWIGGYNRESPPPEEFIWYQPQGCDDDSISYFSWAEGFPKVGDTIETDQINGDTVIQTDELSPKIKKKPGPFDIITDPDDSYGPFIAVSGTLDQTTHGDWITLPQKDTIGYVLEGKVDNSLLGLKEVEGTTFVIEDKVNLAATKQYKVVNINEESNGIFAVQGLQYNSGKFGNIENNLNLPKPLSPVIFTEAPLDNPTNVIISAVAEMPEKSIPLGLEVQWSSVAGAAKYRIQIFNGNTLLATLTQDNDLSSDVQSITYRSEKILEGENYYARIQGVPS